MSTQTKCRCQSCTIRGLTGPAIVIMVGVLFLLQETLGGHFEIGSTWPVLLLVVGLLQLASLFASRQGHVNPQPGVSEMTPPAPLANPPQTHVASREQ
jgi:hypothetical protein